MTIKIIAAVDQNYGIGYKNKLLFRIEEDMQRFRKLTTGHFVVMGRKTFESLPNVLPHRTNVVITRNRLYKQENEKTKDNDVVVINDVDKLLNHYLTSGHQEKDLWVIGGAEVYKMFMPYADEIYLTVINKVAEKVDSYFPIDEIEKLGFVLDDAVNVSSSEVEFSYVKYLKGECE